MLMIDFDETFALTFYNCPFYICTFFCFLHLPLFRTSARSMATSKSSSDVNTICICSFPLNSCDCFRPEYNFFKPKQMVG